MNRLTWHDKLSLSFISLAGNEIFGLLGDLLPLLKKQDIEVVHMAPMQIPNFIIAQRQALFTPEEMQGAHVNKTGGEIYSNMIEASKNETRSSTMAEVPELCHVCGKQFRNLQEHMLVHSEKPPDQEVPLEYQNKCLAIEDKEDNADVEKMKSKQLSCTECGKVFCYPSILAQHMLTHSRKKKCACPWCPQTFTVKTKRKLHMKNHLMQERQCDCCIEAFDSLQLMLEHRKTVHPDVEPFNEKILQKCHSKPDERPTKFICEMCGKMYKCITTLHLHIKENHALEKPTYECKVCGKTYNFIRGYKKHLLLHGERGEYRCSVCNKIFELKERFDVHVRGHNKPYECNACDKRFTSKFLLGKHKLFHIRAAAKPYGCEQCSRRFSTAAAVAFHTSTLHDNKKHLKCDICHEEFYNRFHYEAHYSSHTGVKPYNCDTCGKGYNYNKDLLIHRKRCPPQQAEGQSKETEATPTSASKIFSDVKDVKI